MNGSQLSMLENRLCTIRFDFIALMLGGVHKLYRNIFSV